MVPVCGNLPWATRVSIIRFIPDEWANVIGSHFVRDVRVGGEEGEPTCDVHRNILNICSVLEGEGKNVVGEDREVGL